MGFGDGAYYDNSSLGKAKVLGPIPARLLLVGGARNKNFDDFVILPNTVRSLPNIVGLPRQ